MSSTELLNNREQYSNVFRTVDSDTARVEILTELVLQLGWTEIQLVHSDDHSLQIMADEFENAMAERFICVVSRQKLDAPPQDARFYDTVIDGFFLSPGAKGVILFATQSDIENLFNAARQRDTAGHLFWVSHTEVKSLDGHVHGMDSVALGED